MGKICDTAIFRLKVKTYWKVVSGELGGGAGAWKVNETETVP